MSRSAGSSNGTRSPVARSEDDLLDFDHSRLAHFDVNDARRKLAEQGQVYRAQLVAARWIEGWRERLAEDYISHASEEWGRGFDQALREVTAHLRQGDLIPGGVLHDETDAGSL
jgi:hypothetical protein